MSRLTLNREQGVELLFIARVTHQGLN